jgi:hypothetical protein
MTSRCSVTRNQRAVRRATKDLRPKSTSMVKGGVSDDTTHDLRPIATKVQRNR